MSFWVLKCISKRRWMQKMWMVCFDILGTGRTMQNPPSRGITLTMLSKFSSRANKSWDVPSIMYRFSFPKVWFFFLHSPILSDFGGKTKSSLMIFSLKQFSLTFIAIFFRSLSSFFILLWLSGQLTPRFFPKKIWVSSMAVRMMPTMKLRWF